MTMNIGTKIAVSGLFVLLTIVTTGILAYRSTTALIENNGLVTHTYQVLEKIDVLLTLLDEAETGLRGYVVTGEKRYLEPYDAAIKNINPALSDLKRLTADNSRQQQRVIELEPTIAEKLRVMKETNEKRTEGFEQAATFMKTDRGRTLMEAARRVFDAMREDARNSLKERTDLAENSARSSIQTIGIATALAALIVAGGGIWFARSLTTPVRKLLEGAQRIGGGELNYRVKIERSDEIGGLAQAFDTMAEKREQVTKAMHEAVAKLSSACAEILASTTQQASGAQEQAAAVAQTVATVDEVAQTADQSSQRAQAVGKTVQRTLEVGKAGRKTVDDSVSALQSVREKVELTAENILSLAEQAQAIGEIIATVNDIAEQTNLLALNAAIEASRAGEHGKGFSVVASEVKALADQSKKATGQVRQILGQIQKATNSAVLSTEEVTKGVAEATKVSDQAGQTIKTLADTLAAAAEAAAQIVASSGQQATGIAQIHQAMKSLDQVAKQNVIAMRQVEQAAQNLNELGAQLTELSGR